MTGTRVFSNGLTGGHVLLFFCAFFGVIFAVSATFAYYAVTTYPGEEANAYARGLKYNQTLASRARIEARGWRVNVQYRDGRFVVALADKAGAPLTAERVDVQLRRPATSRFDTVATLREEAPGTYVAVVPLAEGCWDADVRVSENGSEDLYSEKVRLWSGKQS